MKRRLFNLIILQSVLFFSGIATMHAQVSNYRFSQSMGTYTPLSGATTIAVATDVSGTAGLNSILLKTALPFRFTFNNIAYDSCYVADDGFISFGNVTYSGGYPISSPNAVEGIIAAMAGDLWGVFGTSGTITKGSAIITNVTSFNSIAVGKAIAGTGIPAGTTISSFDATAKTITISANATITSATGAIRWAAGEIRTLATGSSPSRKFIIEYVNFADNSTTAQNTTAFSFQIQLEETSNKISVVYGPFATLSTSPRANQIGLRGNSINDFYNRSGTTGTSWSATTLGSTATASVSRNNVNFPANGLTYSWVPATCRFPTGITFSSISSTGFVLGWSAPGTGSAPVGYIWEIRASGLPGSGATGLSASGATTTNSATITGLNAGTAYNIYIRTNCGGNDSSNWSPAKAFKTPCGSTQVAPYKEDFSTFISYLSLPACWTTASGSLGANTKFTAIPSTLISWTPSYWQGNYSDKAALAGIDANIKGEWMISPSIDLGTVANKRVEFDMMIQNIFDRDTILGTDDTFALVISTDNGLTWSNSNILRNWTASNTPLSTSHIEIKLPAYTNTVKFAFYVSEGSVFDKAEKIAINDFAIKDTSCVTVKLGPDIAACSDGSRKDTLDAGTYQGTVNYLWDDNSTGAKRIISTSGTYSVAVTRNGCTQNDTVDASYTPSPITHLGNDTTLCGVDTFWLTPGNPGDFVTWYYISRYDDVLPVTSSGLYIAEVTNMNNCSTFDTIAVKLITTLPNVNLGNDTTFCLGNALTLDAGNPGLHNSWNDGNGEQKKVVSASGSYSVVVTDNDGCTAADTIRVQVLPSPIVSLGADTGICNGAQLVLDAGNTGAQYLWDNSDTNQTRTIDTAGLYTVTVTVANNCAASDSINIIIYSLPRLDSITATALGGGRYRFSVHGTQNIDRYSWDFGDKTTNGINPIETHQYSTSGTYTVILTTTGRGDCGTRSDTIVVTVNTTGIDNNNKGQQTISLFPNPNQGIFQVQYPHDLEQKEFAIYNITGMKVFSSRFNSNGLQFIDLSALPSGIYCLLIVDDKAQWPSYKFMLRK